MSEKQLNNVTPMPNPFAGIGAVVSKPSDYANLTIDVRREVMEVLSSKSPVGYNEVEGVVYDLASNQPATDYKLKDAQSVIENHFGGIALPKNLTADFVKDLAYTRAFNPIEDFHKEIPDWDGKPRLRTFLHDVWGVPDNAYYSTVSHLLMLSIVGRTENTSVFVKSDHAFIITGGQGVGKSTFVKDLAAGNDAIFTDGARLQTNPDDGNNAMLLSKTAINEVAEFQHIGGKQVDRVKNAISLVDLVFRPPYEKTPIRTKFHNTLIGTTNNPEVLNDSTGNRRFLMIDVQQQYNSDYMRANIGQILAEAKDFWYASNRPALTMDNIGGLIGVKTADVTAFTAEMHEKHSLFNPIAELIAAIASGDPDSVANGFGSKLTDDVVRYDNAGQVVAINRNALRGVILAYAQGNSDFDELRDRVNRAAAWRAESKKLLETAGLLEKKFYTASRLRGWFVKM